MKPASCLSWLIASVFVTAAGSTQAAGSLPAIDDAFASGRISQEQQIVYRLTALRDPSSGCGCRTSGSHPGPALWIVALVAFALAGLRRR